MAELIFELEEELEAGERSYGQADYVDGLATVHMSYLLRPLNKTQLQVTHAVNQALKTSFNAADQSQPTDPAVLASALQVEGFSVKLRQAKGGGEGQAAFHSLSNSFLVVHTPVELGHPTHSSLCGVSASPAVKFPSLISCCCGSGLRAAELAQVSGGAEEQCPGAARAVPCSHCPASGCCTELLVDTNFKSHFYVPRCTGRYQALVDLLPPVFVGPACQLEYLVDWMSRELHCSFRQQGESLPPWRQKDSLLSRWRPRTSVDTAFPTPSCQALAICQPCNTRSPVAAGKTWTFESSAAATTQQAPPLLPPSQHRVQCERRAAGVLGQAPAAAVGWVCPASPCTSPLHHYGHQLQGHHSAAHAPSSTSWSCGTRRRVHRVPLVCSATLEGSLLAAVQGGGSPAASLHGASPPDSPGQHWKSGSVSPTSTLRYASLYDSCQEQEVVGERVAGDGGAGTAATQASKQQAALVCPGGREASLLTVQI